MTASVQVDDELDGQIRRLAELGLTTPDQIVREAVRQYAGGIDARQSFLLEADTSWDAFQKDGLHLTGDEVSAWLKGVGTDDAFEMPECQS